MSKLVEQGARRGRARATRQSLRELQDWIGTTGALGVVHRSIKQTPVEVDELHFEGQCAAHPRDIVDRGHGMAAPMEFEHLDSRELLGFNAYYSAAGHDRADGAFDSLRSSARLGAH